MIVHVAGISEPTSTMEQTGIRSQRKHQCAEGREQHWCCTGSHSGSPRSETDCTKPEHRSLSEACASSREFFVFSLRQSSYKRFGFSAFYVHMAGIRSDGGFRAADTIGAANPQSSRVNRREWIGRPCWSRYRLPSKCSTGRQTMYKGSISFDTPMLYTLSFIGLFTIGGMTGIFLASLGMDPHLTETYFIVAHFHYVTVGGMVSAYMAGLHFWWPKITGRMYPESLGRLAAMILFIGFNLTFFPQFVLGLSGYAPAVSRASAGIPGVERLLNRRGLDSCSGLFTASAVSHLVAQVWEDRGGQSLAGYRAGVEDSIASSHRQFSRNSNRDRRSL